MRAQSIQTGGQFGFDTMCAQCLTGGTRRTNTKLIIVFIQAKCDINILSTLHAKYVIRSSNSLHGSLAFIFIWTTHFRYILSDLRFHTHAGRLYDFVSPSESHSFHFCVFSSWFGPKLSSCSGCTCVFSSSMRHCVVSAFSIAIVRSRSISENHSERTFSILSSTNYKLLAEIGIFTYFFRLSLTHHRRITWPITCFSLSSRAAIVRDGWMYHGRSGKSLILANDYSTSTILWGSDLDCLKPSKIAIKYV